MTKLLSDGTERARRTQAARRSKNGRLRRKLADRGPGAMAPDELAELADYEATKRGPGRPRHDPPAPPGVIGDGLTSARIHSTAPPTVDSSLSDPPPVVLGEPDGSGDPELVDAIPEPEPELRSEPEPEPVEPTEAERARARGAGELLAMWIRYCVGIASGESVQIELNPAAIVDGVCAYVSAAGERVALKYSVALPYEDELVCAAAIVLPYGAARAIAARRKRAAESAGEAPAEPTEAAAPEPAPEPVRPGAAPRDPRATMGPLSSTD